VRLSELIADCDPDPAAQYVWSSGADYGDFEGESCDAFVKDLPINRVAADVLIASHRAPQLRKEGAALPSCYKSDCANSLLARLPLDEDALIVPKAATAGGPRGGDVDRARPKRAI
jgi:hypothetical protein